MKVNEVQQQQQPKTVLQKKYICFAEEKYVLQGDYMMTVFSFLGELSRRPSFLNCAFRQFKPFLLVAF